MVPWREAWQHALYGPDGLYRRPAGPAGHFATAAHGPLGPALARVVAGLAAEHDVARVVDVGCGRGELLRALSDLGGAGCVLELVGVDVVDRPADLPGDVGWITAPGGAALPDGEGLAALRRALDGALVLAHEWLDVVPCTVAEVDGRGRLRAVLVDPATGQEALGDELGGDELAWCERWWPPTGPGSRVEVGLARDEAWHGLLSHATGGVAVAVDYGHTRDRRPEHGTLVGYRRGSACPPVPDGSMDLTAHVAVDALGAREVLAQREAVRRWGPSRRPGPDRARTDPAGYLRDLATHSATAALAAPGLGDFCWALTPTG